MLLLTLFNVFLAVSSAKPNILWVMADDMGWGEPGLFPSTSPHGKISTPNLDMFGGQGMRFTNAYAGYTVCAPSRTTLFTGRHSGQFVKYKLRGTDLDPNEKQTTTPEVLQQAGYKTAIFGKSAPLNDPLNLVFDTFMGQIDQAKCHNMYPQVWDSKKEGDLNLPLNHKTRSRELCMGNPKNFNYTTDLFFSHASDWLTTNAQEEKPWFLYISLTTPHAGGWGDVNAESGAPVPTDLQYVNKSWPNVEKDHAAAITYLDLLFGRLMHQLDSLGVSDNTIVFFASDNGAHLEGGHSYTFFNSTGGLKGHKRSQYEGGFRSPTMVRWPGQIKAGTVSDFSWAFWDFMPTVAELSGFSGSLPEDIDGISIVPTLLGKGQKEKEYLFWTWPGDAQLASYVREGHEPSGPQVSLQAPQEQKKGNSGYSVRSGSWKAVVPHCGATMQPAKSDADTMELYHLPSDPFETDNVASNHADQVNTILTLVMSKNLSCHCYQC